MTVEATVGAQGLSEVLERFEAGTSFLLTAPRRAMIATGERAAVTVEACHAVDSLTELLAAEPGRIVLGAVGFDAAPVRLSVPAVATWLSRSTPTARVGCASHREPDWAVRPIPQPGLFVRGVQAAINRLDRDGLDRLVLSRGLALDTATPVSLTAMLRHLVESDPTSHTVAAALPGGRTLIGLSPELVIARRHGVVTVRVLSGRGPRGADPVGDDRLAEELLACETSRHEHERVVTETADLLRPLCSALEFPTRPVIAGTAAGWRLGSELRGVQRDPAATVLDLVLALRANPVVCGTPVAAARHAVREIEVGDRGYHTGSVGWCDREGDGEWVTATRCAIVSPRGLRLHTSTGVSSDSAPVTELADTSADFREILLGLGFSHVP